MKLKNKIAIVTGGGGGIGSAIVKRFCNEGAKVIILDRGTGKDLPDNISESTFYKTDISNEIAVKETISNFDKIDIVVNCASSFVFSSFEDATLANWSEAINTDLIGYINTIKYSLPCLKESPTSSIVNICSINGIRSGPNFAPYSTIRAALIHLTSILAVEFGNYNIRVNAICPGPIETPAIKKVADRYGIDYNEIIQQIGKRTIIGRVGRPEEIANGVLFLASEEASYITGTNLVIDGGAITI